MNFQNKTEFLNSLVKKEDEVDISFFPHKNAWEANHCWSVQIKKPQTSIALNSIISDVLARA